MTPDICRRNHKGNSRSEEANLATAPRKEAACARIYAQAVKVGPTGAIAEELYRALGICDNTGTARCSELKRSGELVVSGRIGRSSNGCNADILVADVCV